MGEEEEEEEVEEKEKKPSQVGPGLEEYMYVFFRFCMRYMFPLLEGFVVVFCMFVLFVGLKKQHVRL